MAHDTDMPGFVVRCAAGLTAFATLVTPTTSARAGATQAPAPGTLRVTVSLVTSDGATVPIRVTPCS